MTSNSESPLPKEERLDEITEECIREVCRAFNVIGLGRKEYHRQIEAQAALRQRIRVLIEEARKEDELPPDDSTDYYPSPR